MWKSVVLLGIAGPLGLLMGAVFWALRDWRAGVIAGCCTVAACLVAATLLVLFRPRFTQFDVFLPLGFSVIWSAVMVPLSLGADLFTAPAAIGSGLILSLCLWKAHQEPGRSRKWLILPALVYLYEMLPINLPGPLDDYLAFGGDAVAAILLQLGYQGRSPLARHDAVGNAPLIEGWTDRRG